MTTSAHLSWSAAWLVACTGCSRVDVFAVTETTNAAGANPTSLDVDPTGGSTNARDLTTSSESVGIDAAAPSVLDPTPPGVAATSPPAVGCPSPALEPGDTSVTLQVGTVSRSYVLHVPATYEGSVPVPLVVDFHGIGGTGWTQLEESPYPDVTDPDGVVMAFPDGLSGPLGSAWNMGPCCVADVDDLAFARALVADVQQAACIDADRVYAVGVLTGGGLVQHLACRAADVFAAVAPAAFDLLEETVDDCDPSRPVTVLSFRGTEDARVPYEGGPSSVVPGMPITFLGAEGTFERWAEIDACTGSPSTEDANGCSFYSGCPSGIEVALCTDHGGAESPGDAFIAWPLLSRHRR